MIALLEAILSRRYRLRGRLLFSLIGNTSIFSPPNYYSPNNSSMNSILQALSQFQAECKPIKKADDNPYFKSKYASLDSIQHHIKPHLSKAGLVVTQAVTVFNDLPFVQTRVWHVESAEFVESLFPLIVTKQSAQDYGSAVSYAKRYSLSGLLNLIIADEDDDGNTVSFKTSEYVNVANTELPPLDQDKYDAMVKFVADGKIREVEAAIKKYTLNATQKKLLLSLINSAKAETITKQAKK